MPYPVPFGDVWDALNAHHVKRFFRTTEEEGLTWEAKAGPISPQSHVVRTAAGFANSKLGGYLVLGANWDKATQAWSFPGFTFKGREVSTWVSSIITSSLAPVPTFDVKTVRIMGTLVAVIAFEPTPTPPAITKEGGVFTRTVGQTLPVQDQALLASLFAAGQASRDDAEARSRRALETAERQRPDVEGGEARFAIAACSVTRPIDVNAALFQAGRRDYFASIIDARLGPSGNRCRLDWSVFQGRLEANYVCQFPLTSSYAFDAHWDGSMAITHLSGRSRDGVSLLLDGELERSWRAMVALLGALGADGETFVAIRATHDRGAGLVSRWTELRDPTPEQVGSVERELRRMRGEEAWEP